MSENEDISSSSSSKSLLPEYVIAILNHPMTEGVGDGYLGLAHKGINDSMIPELCEWIVKLGDKVDDKCMKSLGEYIKSNKSIERIYLDNTSVSDAGIEILAPYFDANTTFKLLHLYNNRRITDKSIPLFIKMIGSSCIEKLGIIGTSITQKNTTCVLSAYNGIKDDSACLVLSESDLNDDDMIKICDAMKKYGIDKLKEINLWNNNITSKGASVLFDTLKECNSIVSELNLSKNRLDDECMKQLGEYLKDNLHLESLCLSINYITDKGVEILSEYLIGNTNMKELIMQINGGITGASAPHLIEMVNKSCITNLDVSCTSVYYVKEQEINEALKTPIEKREIPIKSNTKSAAKISAST